MLGEHYGFHKCILGRFYFHNDTYHYKLVLHEKYSRKISLWLLGIFSAHYAKENASLLPWKVHPQQTTMVGINYKGESGVLGVEVDDLLEVEVEEGDGGAVVVAGEPEYVLEEDGVNVDEEGLALLLPHHRLQEHPKRVGVEHELVDGEHPPLLPDDDRHRRRRRRLVVEGAVAEAGRRGRRPTEEQAAAGHRSTTTTPLVCSAFLSSSCSRARLEWRRGVELEEDRKRSELVYKKKRLDVERAVGATLQISPSSPHTLSYNQDFKVERNSIKAFLVFDGK